MESLVYLKNLRLIYERGWMHDALFWKKIIIIEKMSEKTLVVRPSQDLPIWSEYPILLNAPYLFMPVLSE
jgi:hypothetical protein